MFFDGIPEVYDCLPHIITVNENDVYSHVYLFLGSLEQSIKNCIKYEYDFGDYLGITSTTIRRKGTYQFCCYSDIAVGDEIKMFLLKEVKQCTILKRLTGEQHDARN